MIAALPSITPTPAFEPHDRADVAAVRLRDVRVDADIGAREHLTAAHQRRQAESQRRPVRHDVIEIGEPRDAAVDVRERLVERLGRGR
jgi:hypothetical protein